MTTANLAAIALGPIEILIVCGILLSLAVGVIGVIVLGFVVGRTRGRSGLRTFLPSVKSILTSNTDESKHRH